MLYTYIILYTRALVSKLYSTREKRVSAFFFPNILSSNIVQNFENTSVISVVALFHSSKGHILLALDMKNSSKGHILLALDMKNPRHRHNQRSARTW